MKKRYQPPQIDETVPMPALSSTDSEEIWAAIIERVTRARAAAFRGCATPVVFKEKP